MKNMRTKYIKHLISLFTRSASYKEAFMFTDVASLNKPAKSQGTSFVPSNVIDCASLFAVSCHHGT